MRTKLNAVNPHRCKGDHECWTSALVATAFLGCQEPWEKPQFKCLLEGFMVPLGGFGDLTITQVVFFCMPLVRTNRCKTSSCT
jgi:hypothetical protein